MNWSLQREANAVEVAVSDVPVNSVVMAENKQTRILSSSENRRDRLSGGVLETHSLGESKSWPKSLQHGVFPGGHPTRY